MVAFFSTHPNCGNSKNRRHFVHFSTKPWFLGVDTKPATGACSGCRLLGSRRRAWLGPDSNLREVTAWLVVWNHGMDYDFPYTVLDYWEFHHPNWRTPFFRGGRYTTDQLRRWGSSLHFQKFVAADEQIDLEKFVGRYWTAEMCRSQRQPIFPQHSATGRAMKADPQASLEWLGLT